jgi:hypothetical protein
MQLLRDRFFIAVAAILLVGGYHAVAVHRVSSLKAEVAALQAKVTILEASRLPVAPRRIPAFRRLPRHAHRNAGGGALVLPNDPYRRPPPDTAADRR